MVRCKKECPIKCCCTNYRQIQHLNTKQPQIKLPLAKRIILTQCTELLRGTTLVTLINNTSFKLTLKTMVLKNFMWGLRPHLGGYSLSEISQYLSFFVVFFCSS